MKQIQEQIHSLILQREENKRLYIAPLSQKITALKKLLEQRRRRKRAKK